MRFLTLFTILFAAIPAHAQSSWKAINADIQRVVDNVSKDRLEAIERKLESFETRKTTSPDWEREFYVGNVTQYTMKDVSIDEWVFEARAIGQNGAESLTTAYVNPPRAKSIYKTLP